MRGAYLTDDVYVGPESTPPSPCGSSTIEPLLIGFNDPRAVDFETLLDQEENGTRIIDWPNDYVNERFWTTDLQELQAAFDQRLHKEIEGPFGFENEDGWWAIDLAVEGMTVTRESLGADGVTGDASEQVYEVAYDFRPNAVVHIILLSDEPGGQNTRGEEFVKSLDYTLSSLGIERDAVIGVNGEVLPPGPEDASGSLLSVNGFDPPNTNDYENKISHAVVTAIVPAVFHPALLPALPELGLEADDPVFGIDADVFDYFNVDIHSFVDFNDGPEHDWTAFVCADCDNPAEGGVTNSVDTVLAVTRDTDLLVRTTNAARIEFSQTLPSSEFYYLNKTESWEEDIPLTGIRPQLSPVDVPEESMAELAYDAKDQTYPQEYFFSETYAFLTWETGGTVWDIDHAIGKNQRGGRRRIRGCAPRRADQPTELSNTAIGSGREHRQPLPSRCRGRHV